ncbi:pyridoxamine 5'-phosphate oxidase family protein [Pseudomonas protegens]|uniref:pyridoxamine 5'-phosphate oxidase family protein n=1 Tax=Pseudomonas protegens TaxID=380021 RepID=UPI0037FE0FA5
MSSSSPWHAGERQLQARAGVAERMEAFGTKVIRQAMPDQHRQFYGQLPFILVGAVDAQGNPWASILEGPPGFAQAPEATRLRLGSLPAADDPVQLQEGAALGLLGIELHTRRRNRLNGRVSAVDRHGFSVTVQQAFGNCPQYIQQRELQQVPLSDPASRPAQYRDGLDPEARALIGGADTFFVASYDDLDGQRSVDVSHRGGQAGFVRVEGNCLTIPDFVGNLHFNTLGNLLLNPRAGLLFIDFPSGELLQLSGRTEIIHDGPLVKAFQGAERLWRFTVERLVRRPAALSLRWQLQGFSPNSLLTGSWPQAEARLRATALGQQWRPLRVTRIEDESSSIRSFYLEPADAAGAPSFVPGQHLPVQVVLDGQPLIRTYSLSSAPSDDFLRISVKREGQVSRHLHQALKVGDLLQARAPQGRFTADALSSQPLVLLAAGVGITPLLSMLREVLYQGLRTRHTRPTWLIQGSRTLAEQPFAKELQTLLAQAGDSVRLLRLLSQPEAGARPGAGFDHCGRIDVQLLLAQPDLDLDRADFVLCGPGAFTQGLYDSLRDLDIDDRQIHAETFGPSTLRRRPDPEAVPFAQPPAATRAVAVRFQQAGRELSWEPASGSLLQLAESAGLHPPFSCRGGSCGTCQTRLISGQVNYPQVPAQLPEPGQVLICCAVPAAVDNLVPALVLDL